MTLEVLQSKAQIDLSRKELKRRGLSQTISPLRHSIERILRPQSLVIGDHVKSWDVFRTLQFVESQLTKDQPILDIGCFASEILVILHHAGYQRLHGADLNDSIDSMPYQDVIEYHKTDFMETALADGSYAAITAMSVIEHGFSQTRLLREMSRLLAPEGYFIASFDYWPDKIDTTGVKFFDMDWQIFSSTEVEALISEAKEFGLHPVGEVHLTSSERPIRCAGKAYTFAWIVLQKSALP